MNRSGRLVLCLPGEVAMGPIFHGGTDHPFIAAVGLKATRRTGAAAEDFTR